MPWRETPSDLARAWAERTAVVSAPDGDLNGIFTPPAPEAIPADICVIFCSRPRFDHNRIVVEIARRLAGYGFACFRFDHHAWGDSGGEAESAELHKRYRLDLEKPYQAELTAIIRYLREALGQRRFVLWGRCWDAITAISAFSTEANSIEGLVSIAAPVTRVISDSSHSWRNVVRLAANFERWPEVIISAHFRRRIAVRLRYTLNRSLGRTPSRQAAQLLPNFREHFRLMVHSEARALFLYGADDGELESFRIAERSLFAALDPETRRRFEIVVRPGRIHWMLTMEAHREVVERSISWIRGLHPDRRSERGAASTSATHRIPAQ